MASGLSRLRRKGPSLKIRIAPLREVDGESPLLPISTPSTPTSFLLQSPSPTESRGPVRTPTPTAIRHSFNTLSTGPVPTAVPATPARISRPPTIQSTTRSPTRTIFVTDPAPTLLSTVVVTVQTVITAEGDNRDTLPTTPAAAEAAEASARGSAAVGLEQPASIGGSSAISAQGIVLLAVLGALGR